MASVVQQSVNGAVVVTIDGRIDERFRAPQIPASASKVTLNLGGVSGISSVGVRLLEELLRSLGARELVLIHVSPAIAVQLNLVPALQKLARVESAKLPFACPSCELEKIQSVPWRYDAHLRYAPTCRCGQLMHLDGMPEHYLPERDLPPG
jgi:anti-anti-sigma regulatory factor